MSVVSFAEAKSRKQEIAGSSVAGSSIEGLLGIEYPKEILEDDNGVPYLHDIKEDARLDAFFRAFGFGRESYATTADLCNLWRVLTGYYVPYVKMKLEGDDDILQELATIEAPGWLPYISAVAAGNAEQAKELSKVVDLTQ